MSSLNAEKIRQDFPIFQRKINGKQLIFLDNASTSQKPQQVIDAIKNYYYEHNANPHRSIYKLCEESTELYEKSHDDVAKFVNAAGKEEIILFATQTKL